MLITIILLSLAEFTLLKGQLPVSVVTLCIAMEPGPDAKFRASAGQPSAYKRVGLVLDGCWTQQHLGGEAPTSSYTGSLP